MDTDLVHFLKMAVSTCLHLLSLFLAFKFIIIGRARENADCAAFGRFKKLWAGSKYCYSAQILTRNREIYFMNTYFWSIFSMWAGSIFSFSYSSA
jgi:hypothetical protein